MITDEPGICAGNGGVRIEDLLITAEGNRVLTRAKRINHL